MLVLPNTNLGYCWPVVVFVKNNVLRDICVTFYNCFSLILHLSSNMISLIDIAISVVLSRNPVLVSFTRVGKFMDGCPVFKVLSV